MNYRLYLYILILILIVSGILLLIAVSLSGKKSKSIYVKNKSGGSITGGAYHFFSRFFLTKGYIDKIKSRINMLEFSDSWTVNKRTMEFAFVSSGISILLFIVAILLSHKLYYLIISTFTIYIVHNQVIKLMVERIDDKHLKQFEKFLGDIRHYYHEHGMIDEAIYDVIEECEYEMSLHANKMYEVLSSEDVEGELENYYDLVPNKFFKTFLALCYTVQKFGDRIIDDKSMFLTNLNYLKQEINLEILRRSKINHLFKSLSIIAIAPIFCLPAIEHWAKNNLPELGKYYDGAFGFVVQIILFLVVILCYELINRMQSNQDDIRSTGNRIELTLLKVKKIAEIINTFIYKQFSRAMRIGELLKITGTKTSLESFYLKRILYAIFGFIISFIIFINVNNISRHNLLYTSESLLTDNQLINNQSESEIIDFDRKYILEYSGKNITFQDLEESVKDNENMNSRLAGIIAKRILTKIEKYDNCYFKWWELLICFIIGGLFYYIPYWMLLFRKTIVQMNMEDEVMQFHTIILMLMHIKRISVEDLLEWMRIFAEIFKESIDKCLNNFENGDLDALEQLKFDEPFIPFVRIVENLQAATDRIAINQAFDELKIEREYYKEKRKQDNEIIVSKKGSWGKIIAFIPLTCTLLLYLITPFIHLSISEFISYSNHIKDFI